MKLAKNFLPISLEDLKNLKISQLDFIIVTGDSYVDHPSFGTSLIGRVLESKGYTVGIIAQPNWTNNVDFKKLGTPKLGFLVSSGNIDSMVNNYYTSKKRRKKDVYSPGAVLDLRPDRAVIVYCNKIRENFKNIPIIIGGIEASLRRFAHYDYWDNKIRKSILLDSKADLLVYGMGEKTIVDIADLLKQGVDIKSIKSIKGTAYLSSNEDFPEGYINIPSFEDCIMDKKAYAKSFMLQYREQDPINGKGLTQKHGNRFIVQNPPQHSLTQKEMDEIYEIPFMRNYHPIYEPLGGIPAIEEIKFSIIDHRGCFGSCAFCAITFHQGRTIQNRSERSLLDEAILLSKQDDFKGYIHDLGGPTANFRNKSCKLQETHGMCKNKNCLSPTPCKNLIIDHSDYLNILRKMRKLPGIKKVFIRSGIRYDYLVYDKKDTFFRELCEHHVSGQLKVAPEHISDNVLKVMGKPSINVYNAFCKKYYEINKKINKKQYLVPYLMSSHPGSTLKNAVELAEYIKKMKYTPEQVQDFYPTPGSLATCMYYTGIDPFTNKSIYVAKDAKEKAMQRALLQTNLSVNNKLVREALVKVNRKDLLDLNKKIYIKKKHS